MNSLRVKIINYIVANCILNNPLSRMIARSYLKYFPLIYKKRLYYMSTDRYTIIPQLLAGQSDDYIFSVLKDYIKNGYNIVDIGANVGMHAFYFSELVGKKGKIYAFEPDVSNYNYLKKNIRVNMIRNIIPINKAVSDKNGKTKLYLSEKLTWDHRLINPPGEFRKAVTIEQIKLDSLLVNKKIDFIKIDVQGFEGKCIEGMENLIRKRKHITLFIEFWPKGLLESGTDPYDLINKIKNLGFKILVVNSVEEKVGPLKDVKRLLTLSDYSYVDFLCIK